MGTAIAIRALDFRPSRTVFPLAVGDGRLFVADGFASGEWQGVWVEPSGAPCAAAKSSARVRDDDAPRSSASEPLYVSVDGATECLGNEARSDDDVMLILDRSAGRIAIVRADRDGAVLAPLPPAVASALAAGGGTFAFELVADIDRLVLCPGDGMAHLCSIRALRRLEPGPVSWHVLGVWPRRIADARMTATVTFAGHGRLVLSLPDGTGLSARGSGPVRGERVTLMGKLFDANGVQGWELLVRTNGEQIRLHTADEHQTFECEAIHVPIVPPPSASPADVAQVRDLIVALKRDGFLRELTSEDVETCASEIGWDAAALLRAYFSDPLRGEARAAIEGYCELRFDDGWARLDADAMLAKLCACTGSPPIVTHAGRHGDSDVVLRDRDGVRYRVELEPLSGVVAFINGMLAKSGEARRFHRARGDDDLGMTLVLVAPDVADRLDEAGFPVDLVT